MTSVWEAHVTSIIIQVHHCFIASSRVLGLECVRIFTKHKEMEGVIGTSKLLISARIHSCIWFRELDCREEGILPLLFTH